MSGQPDFHLSADAARALRAVLVAFCHESNAASAALLDQCGTALASSTGTSTSTPAYGEPPDASRPEVAALAAGVYASTRELAARLGDPDCDDVVHHGGRWHFHLCPVGPDHLLLTVFNSSSAAGVVRYCAGRAIPELAALLGPASGGAARPGECARSRTAAAGSAALPA